MTLEEGFVMRKLLSGLFKFVFGTVKFTLAVFLILAGFIIGQMPD